MWVTQMSRDASGFSVAFEKSSELLAADGKESLITEHFDGVIKQGRALIKQRIFVLHERLDGVHGALEPLYVEMSVTDVICFQSNDFAWPKSVGKSH